MKSTLSEENKAEVKPKVKIHWTLFRRKGGVRIYYKIDKVSYTQLAFKELEDYLRNRLYRYYNRKSQRKKRLHGQQAIVKLFREYGLI